MSRALAISLSLCFLAGCVREHPLVIAIGADVPSELRWTVRFFETDAACPAEPGAVDPPGPLRYETAFDGERGAEIGALPDRSYAVVAVGRDAACTVRASGCTSIALGQVSEIRIAARAPAEAIACEASERCVDRRCEASDGSTGEDASVPPDTSVPHDTSIPDDTSVPDAGPLDAATEDASMPDAGPMPRLLQCTPVSVFDSALDGPLDDHFSLATDGDHALVALYSGAVGSARVRLRRVPRSASAAERADLDLASLLSTGGPGRTAVLRTRADGLVHLFVAQRLSGATADPFGHAGALDAETGMLSEQTAITTTADRVIPRLAIAGDASAGAPLSLYWLEDRGGRIAYGWRPLAAGSSVTAANITFASGEAASATGGTFAEAVGSTGRFVAWTGSTDVLGFIDTGALSPRARACSWGFVSGADPLPMGSVLSCLRTFGDSPRAGDVAFAPRGDPGFGFDRTGWAYVGSDQYLVAHRGPDGCDCIAARTLECTAARETCTAVRSEGQASVGGIAGLVSLLPAGAAGVVLTYALGADPRPLDAFLERRVGFAGAPAFRYELPTARPSARIDDIQLALAPDASVALAAVLRREGTEAIVELVEVPLPGGCPAAD